MVSKKPSVTNLNTTQLGHGHLRKAALARQGLLQRNTFGSGLAGTVKAIKHIGYVQIDTISVVERAHHHVLWSRVDNYQPEYLAALLEQKSIFEYWFHAAAYLPINDFRFALPRMNAIRSGEKHWFKSIDQKLLKTVYKRIATEGPLMARDFVDKRSSNTGWWDWKPAKQALEKLFMQGDLMVVKREGFQKRYDLTERVLPADIDTTSPDVYTEAKYLVETTLRAHGFASLKSFTYLRKGAALRAAVKDYVEDLLHQQKISIVATTTDDNFFADTAALASSHSATARVKLISPFDNLVIQRERCRQVFEFDYQIECYVPAAKRRHGYFCLPVLYRDCLVGRIDIKVFRKEKLLRVLYLQFEAKGDKPLLCLAVELQRFMKFNRCDSIDFAPGQRNPHYKKLREYLKQ